MNRRVFLKAALAAAVPAPVAAASYGLFEAGWVKVSMRGRTFRMTAEQVLNHVLPAMAGLKPNLTIRVEHREPGR